MQQSFLPQLSSSMHNLGGMGMGMGGGGLGGMGMGGMGGGMGMNPGIRQEKLHDRLREEKLMGILERQTEILTKIVSKYKNIEENSNRKLQDRIHQLERENEIMIRKRREDYLVNHINESLDSKFRQFNEYQLRPFIESGAPVFLKPLHLDGMGLQNKFAQAENDAFGMPPPDDYDGERKKVKKKKKGKGKRKKKDDDE